MKKTTPNTFNIDKEREKEILSGLSYLIEESKIAKRNIQYSSDMERFKRRIDDIDIRLTAIEEMLIQVTKMI